MGRVEPAYRNKLSLAAQYFVAADILQRGWDCSVAAEGLRYDLIADVGGLRRIQVKMSMFARLCSPRAKTISYPFGAPASGGLRTYLNDIDMFAFVAMDLRKIIYARPKNIDCHALLIPLTRFQNEPPEHSWAESIEEWSAPTRASNIVTAIGVA